ncbi:MAG TPA: DNA polymerase Y family protein [Polyangiaceae bacterium]|nr:DNA polymerase Y family protein [Polyangiaceae bacterium]
MPGELEARKRRILALILPDLLVELALRQRSVSRGAGPEPRSSKPLGVVLVDEPARPVPQQLSLSVGGKPLAPDPELAASEQLSAVNREAERLGVRAGQTIAEGSALVSQLIVLKVTRSEVERTLGSLAEVALGYGASVGIAAPDTVWVDITGAAHLFGGEEALAQDLSERVRELGHRTKVAVSGGPELARAFAHWATPTRSGAGAARSFAGSSVAPGITVILPELTALAAAELPIQALPLALDTVGYLVRLGLLTLGDLSRQPRSALAPRLGKQAARVLELCSGEDSAPLVVYQPPRTLEEESSWEDAVSGTEPLGFVLRGLAARISARLCSRGEAAELLEVTLQHDPVIARFRGVSQSTQLSFKLASPLHREAELRRIVASRLERLKLAAPTVGMKLSVPRLAPLATRQLSLHELLDGDTTSGEEDLPLVLAELGADIGEAQVGVLSLVDAHRPEAQSLLGAALPEGAAPSRRKRPRAAARSAAPESLLRKAEAPIWSKLSSPPTRLLQHPVELSSVISAGSTLVLGHTLYTIERLRFEQRLDSVEWWSRPVARDYLRLWLQSDSGGLEALVYVDRPSGRRFLQAVGD